MKDWILVTKALPPEEEWVITYFPDDKPSIWIGQWRLNTVSSKVEWQDAEGFGIESPTHWCPMPVPPSDLRSKAVVDPDSLTDEIMTLKEAIRGHRDQKHLRYDTADVMLWAHVDE